MSIQNLTEELRLMTDGFDSFGTFIDDAHYLTSFKLYLKCMQGPDFAVHCTEQILPKLPNRRNMLDIGPGTLRMTRIVGKDFERLSLLDVNEDVLSQIDDEPVVAGQEVTKYHSGILEAELPDDSFDFVMCSHMLYYVDRPKWMDVMWKCLKSLTPGGILAVAMSGDEGGKADMDIHFGGGCINIQSWVKECQETFGPEQVDVFHCSEFSSAHDLETMVHLAGFLMGDVDVKKRVTRAAITSYVETNCRTPEAEVEQGKKCYSFKPDRQTWVFIQMAY